MLLHVVTIHNLQGLREQFRGDVPDPRRSVPNHHLARGLQEVPTLRLTLDALGKFRYLGVGIAAGRRLDGRRVADGTRVASGSAFGIPRFRAPNGADLDLPSLGGTIRLLARSPREFLWAHGNAGAIQAEIE